MRTKRRSKRKKVGKFFRNVFELADLAEVFYYIVRGVIWIIVKIIKFISH